MLGYVVADAVIGKFELINYAVALNPNGEIRDVEIVAYRESMASKFATSHGAASLPASPRARPCASAMTSRTSVAPHYRARISPMACGALP